MYRSVEALIIAVLGFVCLIVCLCRLAMKTFTIGLYPHDRFIDALNDVIDSLKMTGYGIAHVVVPMY